MGRPPKGKGRRHHSASQAKSFAKNHGFCHHETPPSANPVITRKLTPTELERTRQGLPTFED